jgi:hypothetical protein
MIKRLLAVALLCLIAYPVSAAMNVRQKGDGTATHEGRTSDWRFQNCVGGVTLQVPILADTLSSAYTVVPITNAVIQPMYSVVGGSMTGTTTLEFFVNQTDHKIGFYDRANALLTAATIHIHAPSAGTVDRLSAFSEVGTATSLVSNTAIEGAYIAVASDGVGAGAVSGVVLFRACPR